MLPKNSSIVLRIGLSLVFLANALVALTAPGEFRDLVGSSFLANLFPGVSAGVFVILIGINDSIMFLILFLNIKKMMKGALIWACIYLVLVMLVIWEPLDGLEHLGFMSIAIALFVDLKSKSAPALN